MNNFSEKVSFIWSVADLIRGPYKPNQYRDVMLPLCVLRRLDCVLEPTKEKVLEKYKSLKDSKVKNLEPILNRVAGQQFHNISKFTFEKLKGDPNNIAANLTNYIKGFSSRAREIIDHFKFEEHIANLDKHDRLFLVVSKFCEIDLHPDKVSNVEMGYIFEELIRKFNEASNEEAGDHFTPREVIRLMVNLIFLPDSETLTKKGIVRTLFDPACGTGGMLSVSEEYLRELNPNANLEVFGQDYNDQAYAICGSDMLIKGENINNVQFGDSFTEDHFGGKNFDYMLANPPFGVEWKPEADDITKEHEEQGFGGRFGAGLPRINDGSFLFLQHMISKMKDPKEGGTRLAIVFNGSPLFTGSAGSGESEIRRWIIENDWLEGIVALPEQLFYNTPLQTYFWIITNRKEKKRMGKIQLIDGTNFFTKMRKSLGDKRNEIDENHRNEITRLYGEFKEGKFVKIFDNQDFAYNRITVERPLRLNYTITEERLQRVKEVGPFVNLAMSKKRKDTKGAEKEIEEGKKLQDAILKALYGLSSHGIIKKREKFIELLKDVFKTKAIAVSTPLFKAILSSLSERDEAADICRDSDGNPEPDPELRDYENVPHKEDIDAYMMREVLPHVPDAWVDHEKNKIGYIIYFNRYFVKNVSTLTCDALENKLKEIKETISEEVDKIAVGLIPDGDLVNTDCEWFPMIPKAWTIQRAKWLFDEINERGFSEETLLSVTQELGVLPRVESDINVWNPGDDVSGYKLIQPGDFVISLRSFQGGIEYSKIRGIISPAYTVLRPRRPDLSPYYRWFMKSKTVIAALQSLSTGIRQGKAIQYSDFCDLPCLLPPTEIALKIAKQLDEKENLINELKKAMKEMLDSQWSIVTSAITGKIKYT